MTDPRQHNCAHQDDGWCLDCMRTEFNATDDIISGLREQVAELGARVRELEAEVAALLQSSPPECPDCGVYPAQWSGKYWRPCEGCLEYQVHQGGG